MGVKVLPPLPVPKRVSEGVKEGGKDTVDTPLSFPVPDPAREGLTSKDADGEGEMEVVPIGVVLGRGLPLALPDPPPPPLILEVGGEDREASGVPLPSGGEGETVLGMEAVTHSVGVGRELRVTAPTPPVGDTAEDGEPFRSVVVGVDRMVGERLVEREGVNVTWEVSDGVDVGREVGKALPVVIPEGEAMGEDV